MTAEFDWSGAPEGERWVVMGPGPTFYYVVGEKNCWACSPTDGEWLMIGPAAAKNIRARGLRVHQPARPVVRVGDRVRVTQTQTWEGHVTRVEDGDLLLLDEHQYPIELSKVTVEVLQRADPPLQPGDIVRDGEGHTYVYLPESPESTLEEPDFVIIPMPSQGDDRLFARYECSDLTGPLVKVQLTEVPGE